jgi:hypothetical protein
MIMKILNCTFERARSGVDQMIRLRDRNSAGVHSSDGCEREVYDLRGGIHVTNSMRISELVFGMVGSEGLEPPTSCL